MRISRSTQGIFQVSATLAPGTSWASFEAAVQILQMYRQQAVAENAERLDRFSPDRSTRPVAAGADARPRPW